MTFEEADYWKERRQRAEDTVEIATQAAKTWESDYEGGRG